MPRQHKPALSPEEVAAILAGLRLLQEGRYSARIEDIATNGGEHDVLADDLIDDLCERVNFRELTE